MATITDTDRLARLTDLLVHHRKAGTQIAELPAGIAPLSLDEAYVVQRDVAARIEGGTVGWKIGMTTRAAQKARGMDTPVYARLFQATTSLEGKAAFPAKEGRQIFEAEYVFELAHDLPAAEYSREDLIGAIRSVRPGIEVCTSRFSTQGALDLAVSLADNSFHAGMVIGAPLEGWRERYLDESVTIHLDDGRHVAGSGRNVLDDPLQSFQWLASVALPDGGLKKGDLIASGAAAMIILETPGAVATVRFGEDVTISAELR